MNAVMTARAARLPRAWDKFTQPMSDSRHNYGVDGGGFLALTWARQELRRHLENLPEWRCATYRTQEDIIDRATDALCSERVIREGWRTRESGPQFFQESTIQADAVWDALQDQLRDVAQILAPELPWRGVQALPDTGARAQAAAVMARMAGASR